MAEQAAGGADGGGAGGDRARSDSAGGDKTAQALRLPKRMAPAEGGGQESHLSDLN